MARTCLHFGEQCSSSSWALIGAFRNKYRDYELTGCRNSSGLKDHTKECHSDAHYHFMQLPSRPSKQDHSWSDSQWLKTFSFAPKCRTIATILYPHRKWRKQQLTSYLSPFFQGKNDLGKSKSILGVHIVYFLAEQGFSESLLVLSLSLSSYLICAISHHQFLCLFWPYHCLSLSTIWTLTSDSSHRLSGSPFRPA